MPAAKSTRSTAISVAEAEALVYGAVVQAPVESLPLADAAGHILREEVRADRDFPPFDRVTMDGVAIAHGVFERGRREFPIEGVQAAGTPRKRLSNPEGCIEVMTGAVLPDGCDCVIPVEELRRTETVAEVSAGTQPARMQNIHRSGSDHKKGDLLLQAGTLLRSPELAVCATVGKSVLSVSRPASVAVVSTGNELVEVEQTPEPHQIRVSNSYAIEAALARNGYARVDRFHAPDDREALGRLFSDLLGRFDLLVISGGVSAGRFDLVPPVLESLGARTRFHRVAQRPGYPLLFALSADGKGVFALPGNPVSALISTHRYILPFLRRRIGAGNSERELAILAEDYRFESSLTLFLTVRIHGDSDGRLSATPVWINGSGDLAGLTESDGFLELPADSSRFEAGSVWPLTRWE